MFEIKPLEVVERKEIKKIYLEAHKLYLNHSASFLVRFYDADEKWVKNEVLDLEGDDYKNWGADDDYVYKKACEKFGLCPEMKEVEVASGADALH